MAEKGKGRGWHGDFWIVILSGRQSAGHARAAKGKTVPWANQTAKQQLKDDEHMKDVMEEMEQIEEQTRPEEDDEQEDVDEDIEEKFEEYMKSDEFEKDTERLLTEKGLEEQGKGIGGPREGTTLHEASMRPNDDFDRLQVLMSQRLEELPDGEKYKEHREIEKDRPTPTDDKPPEERPVEAAIQAVEEESSKIPSAGDQG